MNTEVAPMKCTNPRNNMEVKKPLQISTFIHNVTNLSQTQFHKQLITNLRSLR